MELKFDRDNNVCEYFNEVNSSIMHVLSNDCGLWFNLNDAFKMFSTLKTDKLWFSKNLLPHEKKWVNFKRNGRDSKEVFIPEQKVHDLIAKIQESHNQNVDFIYGIIADYDTTCINIKDMELDVEERIALHALKSESENFNKRTEKYMNVLEGKIGLTEFHEEFMKRIDNELKNIDAKYDNEKCPEDLRQEERAKIIAKKEVYLKEHRRITEYDIIKDINECLKDGLYTIYEFIDSYEEIYDELNYDKNIWNKCDNPYIYDTIDSDYADVKSNINYAEKTIEERMVRGHLIMKAMEELEGKEKQEKSIIEKIFDMARK